MLTAPEIVKLIKAHNILSKISIPKKARDNVNELVKLIESKNYSVDHKKKAIKPKVARGKQITLKQAEELTKPKVDPAVAKQKREEKKKEKEEERKKEIKIAKKEAVQEFKKKRQEAQKKKPKPAPAPKKPMKKEDEVRPKEKVGRPRVDPKKIKVIEPKKKEEPKPVKKIPFNKLNRESIDKLQKELYGGKVNRTVPDTIKLIKEIVNFKGDFTFKENMSKEEKEKLSFSLTVLETNDLLKNVMGKDKKYFIDKVNKFFSS